MNTAKFLAGRDRDAGDVPHLNELAANHAAGH
jgi:hypothetical protein